MLAAVLGSIASTWEASASAQRNVDSAVAALSPVVEALIGSPPRPPSLPQGVLMVATQCNNVTNASDDDLELVDALRSLRRQATRTHITLAADNATWTRLVRLGAGALFDEHMQLNTMAARRALASGPTWHQIDKRMVLCYAWKLFAQASSPYVSTVFIDNDVLILSDTFVADLLDRSLHVSDLTFVQDPARPPKETANSRANLAAARARGSIINAPDMYARGLPPLCTCVMAYRKVQSVQNLLMRAAARLFLHSNPSDVSTRKLSLVRQGDQEMIWFQLATGPPDPMLRLMVLPEEYFCPAWYPAKGKDAKIPYHYFVKAMSSRERPTWTTRWGTYNCHAVHFHHSHHHLINARPYIKQTIIEDFE